MEEVRIQSARGRAKVLGTMVCICGALTFTFWKEGYLFNGFMERPLINVHSSKGSTSELNHGVKNWIKGSALILISNIAWCSWLILQVISTSLKIISLYHRMCQLYLIHGKEFLTWTLLIGCSVQSLPSSIISECSYLLLCFTAIFLPCLDFCKESSLVEARMECAAMDHHILCESTPNISVFMY